MLLLAVIKSRSEKKRGTKYIKWSERMMGRENDLRSGKWFDADYNYVRPTDKKLISEGNGDLLFGSRAVSWESKDPAGGIMKSEMGWRKTRRKWQIGKQRSVLNRLQEGSRGCRRTRVWR